jgi:hypothetical protein
MGNIKHHAIVVTSPVKDMLNKAHIEAKDIFNHRVSEVIQSGTNGYESFFVAPDGSIEGWGKSIEGNTQRDIFIDWINEQAKEDGSNLISFCEVFYGESNGRSQVVRHN